MQIYNCISSSSLKQACIFSNSFNCILPFLHSSKIIPKGTCWVSSFASKIHSAKPLPAKQLMCGRHWSYPVWLSKVLCVSHCAPHTKPAFLPPPQRSWRAVSLKPHYPLGCDHSRCFLKYYLCCLLPPLPLPTSLLRPETANQEISPDLSLNFHRLQSEFPLCYFPMKGEEGGGRGDDSNTLT